jgi:hypothetical protein
MDNPHDLFRAVIAFTGDRIAAIRAIRERFGLDLRSAKEVMLQAEGTASSLDEHQARLAEELERAFTAIAKAGARCPGSIGDGDDLNADPLAS